MLIWKIIFRIFEETIVMKMRVFQESESRKDEFLEKFLDVYWHSNLSQNQIIKRILKSKAKRYYAPVEYAYRYVSMMERGKDIPCHGLTRQMYIDIYKRYKIVSAQHKDLKKIEIITKVVYEEAPQYYISLKTATDYVNAIKNSLLK